MPDADRSRIAAGYEALVSDVDAAPFLAIAEGEPAGLIGFRFRRRLNHATFEGWISDLFVRERFRGRGSGAPCWRRDRRVAAAAGPWDGAGDGYERTAARTLYDALGFGELGKHFQLGPVGPRASPRPGGVEIRPI